MACINILTLLLAATDACDSTFLGGQPEATQRVFCQWSQKPDTSPTATVALAAVYARPQFAFARAPTDEAQDSLWQQLEAWLAAQLDTQGAARFSQSTRVVVLLVGVLAVLLLFRRKLRRGDTESAAAQLPSATLLPLEAQSQPWQQRLADAHRLLRQSPRLAMHQGSVALLQCLQSTAWLPQGALTFREASISLRTLEKKQPNVTDCAALLQTFDPLFYSLQPIEEGQGLAFLQDIDNVTNNLRRKT